MPGWNTPTHRLAGFRGSGSALRVAATSANPAATDRRRRALTLNCPRLASGPLPPRADGPRWWSLSLRRRVQEL